MMEDVRSYGVKLLGQGPRWEVARNRLLEAVEAITGDDELPVADEEVARLGDHRYLRVVQTMIDGNDRKALQLFESYTAMENEHPAYRMLYAYLLYRDDRRWRARDVMEPLLSNPGYRREHLEVLYYGARIQWLEDENQRAAQLALEFVDERARRRNALVDGFHAENTR
jgi:hypothetical protein